ncbi:MAG: hypothetical protein HXS48_07060 [Theionarchaea archaeon]|nr:hypothetical protein [Theionarchaea archaeon]
MKKMKTQIILLAVTALLVTPVILIDYYIANSFVLSMLVYGGIIPLALTLYMFKKIIPSISYFVMIFLVIGAMWGLMGRSIENYYKDAGFYAFCQANIERGNPCECPGSRGGRNPCEGMPLGEGILYTIHPWEGLPRPPSDNVSPPGEYYRFNSEPTILGTITYLPYVIVHHVMGLPPSDIYFLVWIWLYPQMVVGMIMWGAAGYGLRAVTKRGFQWVTKNA